MSDEMRQQVARYNHLVQQYHALDHRIDDLLHAHQGHTENMSQASLDQYRQWARERDDLFNHMRMMEKELFAD